jgi:hypothetical protein
VAENRDLGQDQDTEPVAPIIELANADEVRAYIRKLQMAIDDLEDLLHEAPPLRFAPKQTLKA